MLARLIVSAVAATALWAPSAHAAQSYDNCTGFIDSLPAVISTQGTWCLRKNLSTGLTHGRAIEIATNNVTLDCNDFKIGGAAAGPTTDAIGVYSEYRLNITVRRCNVRGFKTGIKLDRMGGSGGHLVEDNRLDGNLNYGIVVVGDNSTVRRNVIHDTLGSDYSGTEAIAISTLGNVDVQDNLVDVVSELYSPFGISVHANTGGSITGNRVRNLRHSTAGRAVGIQVADGSFDVLVQGNLVDGEGTTDQAATKGTAVECASGTRVLVHDNVLVGFDAATTGCISSGNHSD